MFAKLVAAFVLVCATIQSRDMPMLDPQKQTVSIAVDTSVLAAALVKLGGSYTRTQSGIVLDAGKPDNLCGQNREITVHDRPMSTFLDELLAQSGYIWSLDSGVIVIRPAHLSDQVSRVLNVKFDKVGDAYNHAGVTVSSSQIEYSCGCIQDHDQRNRRYPFFTGCRAVSRLDARNASVEQILNQLVTLGSKGIWLFQLSPDFEHNRDLIFTFTLIRTMRMLCFRLVAPSRTERPNADTLLK